MRTQLASIVVGSVLAAQFAHASDVAYKLDTKGLIANESTKMAEPAKLTIVNREWAAPGIEQSTCDLLPPRSFDASVPPRLHLEAAADSPWPHTTDGGPEWLDDVAWPLTRELYGLGRPDYPHDNQQIFWFGGVGLQR